MVLPGKGMGWKEFFGALKSEYKRDKVGDTAGALTFAGMLAFFPFLVFLVALAGLVIDPTTAEQLVNQLKGVAPQQVVDILGGRIKALGAESNVGLLTVGALAAVWSASGGVMALIRALNTTYDVEEGRPFWKVRLLAIGVTLGAALLSLIATGLAVAMRPIGEALGGPLGTALVWLRLPVAGAVMMLVWALLYYLLPDVEQKFRFISPGSIAGVVIWVIASWGFSFYVAHFGKYDAVYGALGGVIVLLLWMWISAQVLLLGAEINSILEHKSSEGKRHGAKRQADSGPSDPAPERAEASRHPQPGQAHSGPRPPARPEGGNGKGGRRAGRWA